ncbi:MAG: DUF6600 domain-containing protein [Thermoanaerobaculia bacterium]
MRIQRTLFAAALAATLSGLTTPAPARADVSVSVSFFHQQLAPHGRWVSAASYGEVWIPGSVAAGWAPYLDGEWLYTDYGWTWVSDDPWGDIAYHYGTWAWADPYGWVWVPGTVWAPSWVTWAYTDDYIGWAPVPPSFVLSVGGYSGRPIVVSETRYVFVPARQFVGVRVSGVRVAPRQNAAIFRRAAKATSFQVSNGIVRTAGLPSERVAKAAGRTIERVSITRARTQPTAFAQGGFGNAKSIPVVAPKRDRVKAAPAPRSEAARAPREAPKPNATNRQPAKPQAAIRERGETRPAPKPQSEKAEREVRPPAPVQAHASAPKPHASAPKAHASAPKPHASVSKPHASAPKAKPQSGSRPDTRKHDKKPETRKHDTKPETRKHDTKK